MEVLQAVLLTLEDIEVRGSENLSRLLGCINAIKEIINNPKGKDGEEVNG